MRSFLRKRGYILLYLLLLCTFFTPLPPVSLSSSAPPQPPHGHMYVLCLSTSPSSHYPTLRPVPPTFRSALTQVLYLSHNNSTHWDLQSIPITFPLGVISCKLSHPSLPAQIPWWITIIIIITPMFSFCLIYLPGKISNLDLPSTFTQATACLWQKTHNHVIYHFIWALRSL